MKRLIAPVIVLALALAWAGRARADIIAAYLQGQGGVSSASPEGARTSGQSSSSDNTGLGLTLGMRVLIFEGYVDHTRFGEGQSASRGIVGVRAGIGTEGLRLVLRAGVGALVERGGALTERIPTSLERTGGVARAGASLEAKLATALWGGIGLDGEAFTLGNTAGEAFGSNAVRGTDLFASLRLLFEVGI